MRTRLRRTPAHIAVMLLATIGGAALAGDSSPPMPEVKRINAHAAFPVEELRNKREGTVEVEFSIDAKGIPRNVMVTKSASGAFDSSARKAIRSARFTVTEAWIAAQGPAARYQTRVVFDVAPCAKPPEDARMMFVCGAISRL